MGNGINSSGEGWGNGGNGPLGLKIVPTKHLNQRSGGELIKGAALRMSLFGQQVAAIIGARGLQDAQSRPSS